MSGPEKKANGARDSKTEEEARAKAFLDDAYALESEADAVAFYDRWADEYDAQVEQGLRYIAPGLLSDALARHQGALDEAVLDVGCGTGLAGACLADRGFSLVDGIDLSAAMLAKAGEKGVYRKLIEADLNAPLPFEDGAYAALVSTGTFTRGHVGPEPLDELMRIVKPGGVFACTVHGEVWESQGFSDKFAELEESGVLVAVEKTLGCYFEGKEPIAWYCVFRRS